MITVVIDTNILIDCWRDDNSYARRIMDLVMDGKIKAIASDQILRENQVILNRLINDKKHEQLVNNFFSYIEVIRVNKRVNVVKYDKDDNKFLACAEEGKADYIISNDSHLWEIGEYQGTKILRPEDFWLEYQASQDESGEEEWKSWVGDILG